MATTDAEFSPVIGDLQTACDALNDVLLSGMLPRQYRQGIEDARDVAARVIYDLSEDDE